jgi:Na+/proline symporter
MGVLIGAVFAAPEHIGSMAAKLNTDTTGITNVLKNDPDRMVPMFILTFLPAGVVGLAFIAIISALMSSLDSAINSLSAVTMQDFYRVYVRPHASERHYVIISRLLTLFWGAFCVIAALSFASAAEATRQTTIVLINAVGSLLYGPVLAAFFIGMATRTITGFQIKIGVIAGIMMNIYLWRSTDVSWLWWNLVGFAITVAVSVGLHILRMTFARYRLDVGLLRPNLGYEKGSNSTPLSIILYFFVIISVACLIQSIG